MYKFNLLYMANQSIRNVAKPQLYLSTISTKTSAEAEAKVANAAKVVEQTTDKSLLQNYTLEQQQKILNIVNKNDIQEILDYDIAKTRATKLTAWKKRNGPLKNVEDILLIDGFGIKFAEKFYRSMLEGNGEKLKATHPSRKSITVFVTPTIEVEHRLAIRSCVSLRIGVSSVTWARLELPTLESTNVPCSLTHWQHHEITEKKLHLSDLVQRLLYVDHLIPKADCYLFENPQMAQINSNPGSMDQQNISIQKSQVTAVLAYALCARGRYDEALRSGHEQIGETDKKLVNKRSNVFYLRRFLTARLFSQLVGTERVSSEETILQLMRLHFNVEDLLEDAAESGHHSKMVTKQHLSQRGNVHFPLTLREMFSRAERYQRELLGQSLLLNLAFVRLVLLQDENSIAVMTRNPNKG